MVTVRSIIEDKVTEKRSRFLALLFPATSLEDVKAAVQRRRRDLPRARHHCWACRIRTADGRWIEQARDDAEVGRPGQVLLEALRHHDLAGALVVSRIFGGVKLGPGGVSRAFQRAAAAVIARHPA